MYIVQCLRFLLSVLTAAVPNGDVQACASRDAVHLPHARHDDAKFVWQTFTERCPSNLHYSFRGRRPDGLTLYSGLSRIQDHYFSNGFLTLRRC